MRAKVTSWPRGLRCARCAWAVLVACAVLSRIPVGASGTLTNADPAVLRQAVQEGGMIRLDFNGVLALTSTLTITNSATVDASGRAVVLDGQNLVRHFVVTNGASLRLVNLKLVRGRHFGETGASNQFGGIGCGGAIYNTGARVELVDCWFEDNAVTGGKGGFPSGDVSRGMRGGAAYGGALYSGNGGLFVTNCTFANSRATGGEGEQSIFLSPYTGGGGDAFGGAIYMTNSTSTLVGVRFTKNVAQGGASSQGRAREGGGGAFGGALCDDDASMSIIGCRFTENRAAGSVKVVSDLSRDTGVAKGGALFHGHGTMEVRDTLLEANLAIGGWGIERGGAPPISADGKGGGVYSSGTLRFENSALIGNRANGGGASGGPIQPSAGQAGAGRGGGLANEGLLTMVNCTLADNLAEGGARSEFPSFPGHASGGGVVILGGTISFLNVTFAGNRADADSPATAFGAAITIEAGTAACTNSILFSLPGQTNVFGQLDDGGHNICSDASAQFTVTSSRGNIDPLLGPLGNHGGPTPTVAVLPASPAIDAGDDDAGPATDQRGVKRPQGSACDIGAFELAPRLALGPMEQGVTTVQYQFKANEVNIFSVSTDLMNWSSLGSKMADTNGVSDLEPVDLSESPARFYTVEPALVPRTVGVRVSPY